MACEVDGFSRFSKASGFAAWVGLVPSEHSGGESRGRDGITKAGNRHLRKLLVEAAWHYKSASRAPKSLARGQKVAPEVRRYANAGVGEWSIGDERWTPQAISRTSPMSR